ncbi:MAG: hypothetical protein H6Q13_674 [Bacteroidetes bacterium]|nr:hypothetical protein [Bacteroidota bacterium]
MRHGLILLLVFFTASCIIGACSEGNHSNPTLIKVDSLLSTQPHEALRILQEIKPTSLSSKEERAYYGLLLVQATDKSELALLPCDSLVDIALDFYDGGVNKARALFYKGRILVKMGHEKEAMDCYYKALSELGNAYVEIRIRGMIHEDLGALYLDQCLYNKALNELNAAFKYYSSIQDKKAMVNVSSFISTIYIAQMKKKKALSTLHRMLKLSYLTNDSLTIGYTIQNLSGYYNFFDELDSALACAKKALNYFPAGKDRSKTLSLIGRVYLQKEQVDSARFYLEKSVNTKDIKAKAITYDALAELEENSGNYRGAFGYLEEYSNIVDSFYFADKSSEIEQLIYKYDAETRVAKHKAEMRQINTLIVAVSVIAILILALILQHVSRRKKVAKLVYEQQAEKMKYEIEHLQMRINENIDLIVHLRREQQGHESEIVQKEQEINDLYCRRMNMWNLMFRQTVIYKKIERLDAEEVSKEKEAKVFTLSEQQALKSAIFDIYHEYITDLRLRYPRLTEEDFLYSCLKEAGLKSLTIARCFGHSSKQVANQRFYRLKFKMSSEEQLLSD